MIDTDRYQELARRTECDETRAVARMAGILMSQTKDYPLVRMVAIRLNHAALGLITEAGEFADLVKKWVYYGRGDLDKGKVGEELGDVLWYVALACNALGLRMSDIMEANIRKLTQRYPEKFTEERAINRDLDAEREALERREREEIVRMEEGLQKMGLMPDQVMGYAECLCHTLGPGDRGNCPRHGEVTGLAL